MKIQSSNGYFPKEEFCPRPLCRFRMALNGCVCVHMHICTLLWHMAQTLSLNCSLKIMFIVLFPLCLSRFTCYFSYVYFMWLRFWTLCLGATKGVLGDTANVARMRWTVKTWTLTAGKKTVQKSAATTESVSVDSVCVGRGTIQMKFILANSASVIISTVIDPMA